MRRRSFLKGAAAVTVVAAGGGVWRAYDQGVFSVGQGPPYQPWNDWRARPNDGALGLVRAAILAASPHNTQPWLFKVTRSSIEMHLDTKRNVGALDPYLREEYIGIGCALENLMLAAAANGYAATVTRTPGKLERIPSDPTPQLVARVDLAQRMRAASELYDAIPRRHTNRGPFSPDRPLPPHFVDTLGQLGSDEQDAKMFIYTSRADRKRIVDVSSAANTEIYSDPEVRRGAERWIRTSWRSLQKLRDGIAIDNFGLPPVAAAITKMMPLWMLQWAASREQPDGYSELMLSAPLIGIIAVRDRYDRDQCLAAGRIWQRAHLLATARGLAGRPCNEAVEMVDHERALGRPPRRLGVLGEIVGDANWQPTFVFYMGHALAEAHASPRRSIEDVIL